MVKMTIDSLDCEETDIVSPKVEEDSRSRDHGSTAEFSKGKCQDSKSSSCVLESFLTTSLPFSFVRNHDVVCCDVCKVLVIKNRFKQHYVDRHVGGDSSTMIPFEEDNATDDRKHKIKKIKRNRKKRASFKEKCSVEVLVEKKKCKKVKIRVVNKRQNPRSFLEGGSDYFGKKKKFKMTKNVLSMEEEDEKVKEKYLVADEGFMSSSPKVSDHIYFHREDGNDGIQNSGSLSLDMGSTNDGMYCSYDSVHRTSSDSSTPPSLSLGTLHTLSSPSSLNILNDPSSVVTEHYFLLSNDITPDRSGVSGKYQIDSLPWENFPSTQHKEPTDYTSYSINVQESIVDLHGHVEEDGEVARAVQSITNFFDIPSNHSHQYRRHRRHLFDSKMLMTRTSLNEECDDGDDDMHPKTQMFTSDETSMIDCFLDEVLGSCNNNTNNTDTNSKDNVVDFGSCSSSFTTNTTTSNNTSIAPRVHLSVEGTNQLDSLITDDGNNLCDYQLESALLTSFSSDYDEKFETLINNAMNEFVTHSPHNTISFASLTSDDKARSHDMFDPLKHCGVPASNGLLCHRSLLCKLHTMPQKRLVDRPESVTTLIKGIRDVNKRKRQYKKEAQYCNAFKWSDSSKTSSDSFTYTCSSNRSTEEASSFMDNRLSTPDLDVSVFNVGTDANVHLSSNTFDVRPLTKSMFEESTVVHGHRSLVSMKCLRWRDRPKSSCNSLRFQQLSPLHVLRSENYGTEVDTINKLSMTNNHDMSQSFSLHYGLSSLSNESIYVNNRKEDEVNLLENNHSSNHAMSKSHVPLNGSHLLRTYNNGATSHSGNNVLLSKPELLTSSSPTMSSLHLSTSAMSNISLMSPGFFTSCNNQLVNINSQFINQSDFSSINSNMVFSDAGLSQGGFSLTNMTNNNNTTNIISDVSSANPKFISIVEDASSNPASYLYPVRNGNQIMMVMNKNNRLYSGDGQDLFGDHLVSVNQSNNVNQQLASLPLNSFFTLKQNDSKNMVQQDSGASLSTPQIVSISPVELQRLSDNFTNNSFGAHIITNDCINTSNDKSNSIIYQLNQLNQPIQPANNFVSKVVDSSSVPKPLTVQSSSINGLTQKFVILPDGTISTFMQQPSNVKATFNQMNRNPVQPIFNQLTNYGPNQAYLINNDKIFITQNQGAMSNNVTQQIIMPQIINQTDINSHSSSAVTFIHPQHHNQSCKTQKLNTRVSAHNNLQTQIPVDSSQQKVAFQIQTQNPYPSQIPNNTFFITAAHPTSSANVPMKQQIFLQSSDQFAQDVSLDSLGFFDGQCNSSQQSKSMDPEIHVISSSSQDFEIVNHHHVLNQPQSIILQQQQQPTTVSRFSTKTMLPCSSSSSSSLSAATLEIGTHCLDSGLVTAMPSGSTSQHNQHTLVVNPHHSHSKNHQHHNASHNNDQCAHSQMMFSSQRHLAASSIPYGTSPGVTLTSSHKSGPPPLVISPQMLHQSASNQLKQKLLNDNNSYVQQQPLAPTQKGSQLGQLVMDDSQLSSNEFMIVQSLIA